MKKILLSFLFVILMTGLVKGQASEKLVMQLIRADSLQSFSRLIENGLNVNTAYNGRTLLHIATEYGKYDIVKYLVDKGADMNIQDKYQRTPLLISTSETWRNDSISEFLINKGANLNIVGIYGTTALRNTVGAGGVGQKSHLFELMIEKGADIEYKCDECCDRGIFLYCCAWGTDEMLQLLIDKKTNINQVDCKGMTGLMYATKTGNITAIKLLLKNGADKTLKDKSGKTAMNYAEKAKNKEIAELLK